MRYLFRKDWWEAALTRAIKTFAQAALSSGLVSGLALKEVEWAAVLSIAAVAAIISILMSLAGLPEVDKDVVTIYFDDQIGPESSDGVPVIQDESEESTLEENDAR